VTGLKEDLHRYLREGRQALLVKLDGLSEHDARRPLTRTGSNVLGVLKHVAVVEAGYLGLVFDRPFPEPLPGYAEDDEPNADMWATAQESRDDVVALAHRVWAHTDATVEALDLDAEGTVPWWRPEGRQVTLGRVLVHLVAEVHRHAGHVDLLRETLDGSAGLRRPGDNLPEVDDAWWPAYVQRLQEVADRFRSGTDEEGSAAAS
jgi:uncharacterized damage-inducible protein DinB